MVRAQTISPILTPYICIHIHIHTKFCRSTHAATRIARGVHYMHSDTLRIRICIYTYMCNSAALLIQPIRRPPHTDRTRIRDLPPSTYTSAALHTQIARESDDFLYSLRNTYVILTLIQPIRRPAHTDRVRIRVLPPSTYTSAALHL